MSKPSARASKIRTQDEPFNLDAIEKESSGHDYQFTLADRVWTMTPLGRLDRKDVRKISRMTKDEATDEMDFIDEMLRLAMGEEQYAEFDELPLTQEGLQSLFEDWTDHSGIDVPESSASSN
jgi:hypothetical protein